MDLGRLLDSLRRAVERAPDDDVLRAHLAELLLQAGVTPEAIGHLGRLLVADPTNPEYLALMRRATQADPGPSEASDAAAWLPPDRAQPPPSRPTPVPIRTATTGGPRRTTSSPAWRTSRWRRRSASAMSADWPT